MAKLGHLFAGLIVTLASSLSAGSACAQGSQTWVSGKGSGSTCTRDLPCRLFSTAQDLTTAGGVITVLDPFNDGLGITITKSLTIRAEGLAAGGIDAPAPLNNWVRVTAGASDVVTLEGLQFDGKGGVAFETGGHLHIVRCVIAGDPQMGGSGIRFEPSAASKLSVTDTVITNNGSSIGGGIVISPRSSGTARVALERVIVNGNAFGIAADGSGSTGGINMTIADSMIAGNSQDGIIAVTQSGGAAIGLMVTNTKSVNNAIGIRSIGPNVTVRVKNSDVMGNGTGLSFFNGGVLATYGNNAVNANATNGAFSGSLPLQ